MLGAALAGLLCLAGCSTKDAPETSANAAGEANQAAGAGGTESASGHGGAGATGASGEHAGGETTAGGAIAAGGAVDVGGGAGAGAAGAGAAGVPAADAGGADGAGGAAPELPHITSSQNVGVMTEEQFKALCDERGGTVEVMPHCGGFATAKGFSYDTSTELLSEHTCHGANTCGGWNCAIPD